MKETSSVSLDSLKKLSLSIYDDFKNKGYFDEYFGFSCIDLDFVPGIAGENLKNYALRELRKDIWPFDISHARKYSEEDLFDMIEYLFVTYQSRLKKADHITVMVIADGIM